MTVTVLASLAVATSSVQPAAAVAPAIAVPDAALNTLWNSYGDLGGHWTGGDSTASVALPDGRVAWLFSDTFLGSVNADHSRPASAPFVHNSIVVQQQDGQLDQTLTGGTPTAPASLVQVSGSALVSWVGDGTVEGNTLRVIYDQFQFTGSGALDFRLAGAAIASFSLPSLTLTGVQQLPLGTTIDWGGSLLEDGGYTYIYGSERDASGLTFAHVARVPAGGLTGAWQFWDGTGWSASESASARLLSGVGTAYSVARVGSSYALVTQDSNLPFSSNLIAYRSSSPTGPFTDPTVIYQAPEPAKGPGRIIYDARIHSELSTSARLVVSYNANSLEPGDNTQDVGIYRPRFLDVSWPPPAPNPPGSPASPTGLTATTGNDGVVHLTWSPPSGTGLTYRVYQRDVTAGQTFPSRGTVDVTTNSADVGISRSGDTWQFTVTAVNSSGEGPPSAPASVTVTITPPPAPTTLVATPDARGQIALSWSAVAGAASYAVYQRDVTEGETEFTPEGYLSTSGTTALVRNLKQDHQYEFQVTDRNGGGESAPSVSVTATAHADPPPVPTGLTATPQSDGTIHLTWTSSVPGLWFWIYQRDVTAGDETLTKLPYPITTGTEFTAGLLIPGHDYEYAVAAISVGGDSALSTTVSATATLAPVPAPTGLTATANPDGTVTLNWAAPDTGLWYWIYERDVTDAEADFTQLPYPITDGTSFTAGLLTQDHTYQFEVSSIGPGGRDSTPAGPVQAVAHTNPPPAPTNLRITPGAGEAALTWDSTASGLWYWIYERDVTDAEADFTRLPYPVTTGAAFTAGLLTNGHTYEFKVSAINGGGEGPASAAVSVTPQAPRLPAPTGLTAIPGSDGTIALRWNSLGDGIWYWIYQRDVTAGETFTKLVYPVTTGPSFTAGLLQNNHVYAYEIAGINGAGDGVLSAPVQATAHWAPPPAPTNLRGFSSGDGSITLDWDAPAPSLYYFVYWRDVTAGETAFTKGSYPTTDTDATLGSLRDSHVYEFKVTGDNPGGEGPASATVRITSHGGLPAAPTGLAAQPGDGQVHLTWHASTTPSVLYVLYQRDTTIGQSWQRLSIPTSATSADLGYLTDGHQYQFKVTAANASGESPASNIATATPMPPRPTAPTGLTATPGVGEVALHWTASTPPSVFYWIELRDATVGQGWTRLPLPTTDTSATAGFLRGHTYQFRVVAENLAGESPPSTVVSAVPLPPLPPTNLTATPRPAAVVLNWTASATPNVWYWVEMRDATANQPWQRLPYPISSGTSFTAGLLKAHSYQFRIRSTGASGDSAPSTVVTAAPQAPAPPTGLTATAGNARVSLHWSASPTANVWYWIEQRDATRNQAWQRLPYPITHGTSYTSTLLFNGDTYQFRVRSTGSSGDSAPSNVVSARPMPPFPTAPTNFVASADDEKGGEVDLRWMASSTSDTAYEFFYRDVSRSQTSWTPFYPVPVYATSALAFDLIPGDVYEFSIFGTNISGTSARIITRAVPRPWNLDYGMLRWVQINGADATAHGFMAGHHLSCQSSSLQKVCFGYAPLDGHPKTIGNYFFWPGSKSNLDSHLDCEAYHRLDLLQRFGSGVANQYGPNVLAHESAHTRQQNTVEPFPNWYTDYLGEVAKSQVFYGNFWEGNSYEQRANLWWGGYKSYHDETFHWNGVSC